MPLIGVLEEIELAQDQYPSVIEPYGQVWGSKIRS
jgi:hypothetical protein